MRFARITLIFLFGYSVPTASCIRARLTTPAPQLLELLTFQQGYNYVDGVPLGPVPVSNLALSGDTLRIRARLLRGMQWPPRTYLDVEDHRVRLSLTWHYVRPLIDFRSQQVVYFEARVGPVTPGLWRVELHQAVDSSASNVTWQDSIVKQ